MMDELRKESSVSVDVHLTPVLLHLCEPCRTGAGGECHTPGCALWMNRAPDIPVPHEPFVTDEMIERGAREVALFEMNGGRSLKQPTREVAEAVLRAALEVTDDQ